jgi:hypothetical protein
LFRSSLEERIGALSQPFCYLSGNLYTQALPYQSRWPATSSGTQEEILVGE